MKKMNRRRKKIYNSFDFNKKYNFKEAVFFIKNQPKLKFIENIEISIKLGINPKKFEQNIRGSLVLPYGTGRLTNIAVFTKGKNIEVAKISGADFVGLEDLFTKIEKNKINVHVALATPDVMDFVSTVAHVLGPKGLMPNLKDGTVIKDISESVKSIKNGQVRFKNDKDSNLHIVIGKMSFSYEQLKENFKSILLYLNKIKPASLKGIFIKKITLSSTMGIGINIDQKE